jgi:hypothetical protein
MTVTCTWDNEAPTILIVTFEGRWNWLELQRVLESGETLLDESEAGRVHLMIDGTHTLSLMNSDVINHLRAWVEKMKIDPRIDRVCVVGSGAITNSFLSVFVKVAMNKLGSPLLFANTVEDARDVLLSDDN